MADGAQRNCLLCDEPLVFEGPIGNWSRIAAAPPARFVCRRCAREKVVRTGREIRVDGTRFLAFAGHWAHTDAPEWQHLWREAS